MDFKNNLLKCASELGFAILSREYPILLDFHQRRIKIYEENSKVIIDYININKDIMKQMRPIDLIAWDKHYLKGILDFFKDNNIDVEVL